MRFDGKVGVVTGAGSGIGRATAIGFAQRGGKVVVADVNGDNAASVVAEITAAGGTALAVAADMTNPPEIDAMLDRAVEAYGRLDVLHNNAFGVPPTLQGRRMARVAELDQGVWDYSLQVGLTAVMQATRSVLPIMLRQGGGAIVNTASISGLFGDYGIAAYNAMKAGVVNFTRVVAMEYAGKISAATASALARSTRRCCAVRSIRSRGFPRRPLRPSRWGVWASRRRWRMSCCSWHRTSRPTSPARRSSRMEG